MWESILAVYSSLIILPQSLSLSSLLVSPLLFFSPLLFLVLLSKSCLLLSLSNVHPSISSRFSPSFDVPFRTKEGSQAGPHGGLRGDLPCDWQHYVGLAAPSLSFRQEKWREPRAVEQRETVRGYLCADVLIILDLRDSKRKFIVKFSVAFTYVLGI